MTGPLAPETQAAPARYTAHGRETIDRIRDLAGALGDALAVGVGRPNAAEFLADNLFTYFCLGNALKYEDRAGLKGPREEDEAKAAFYRAMASHVKRGGPDPRSARPDFAPYAREPWGHPVDLGRPVLTRERPEAYPRLVDLLVSCYSAQELEGLSRYLRVEEYMPVHATKRDWAEALTDLVDLPNIYAALCRDRPRRVPEIDEVFAELTPRASVSIPPSPRALGVPGERD